jgi:NADH-quinone oxidoreductase subunit F
MSALTGAMNELRPLTGKIRPGAPPVDLTAYEAAGGWQSARRAVRELEPEAVIRLVKESGLRGRGGAGFPTADKWGAVPRAENGPRPRYIAVNADEMEPGTFKDRYLIEGDPHLLLEGIAIAAHAVGAEVAYIFLRWEYRRAAAILEHALAEATRARHLGSDVFGSGRRLMVHLHTSAGRYMCGEETGLLNALEGRRATPRARPPYPPVVGLWGKPTVVNNVETLCAVPAIIANGAAWWKGLARTGGDGTKLYGMSGRVRRPGVWELPLGTTLRELLDEHAGGMQDGLRFRGALPGGASTDFLVEEHLDVPLDFTAPQKAGSRLGTGTVVVLDDRTCPVGMVANLERFFARESCGFCTPCREGLPWLARTLGALEQGRGQPGDLEAMAAQMRFLGPGFTFCALAPGAIEPLGSALRYFRADFEEHIALGRCPRA